MKNFFNNISINRIFQSVLAGFLVGISIYYQFIQIPGIVSLKRIVFGIACSFIFTIIFFIFWPWFEKLKTKINRIPGIVSGLFLAIIFIINSSGAQNLILDNLLVNSRIEFSTRSADGPIVFKWLNNGFRDISYRELLVQNGSSQVSDSGITFFPNSSSDMVISWKGPAIDSISGEIEGTGEKTRLAIKLNKVEVKDAILTASGEPYQFKLLLKLPFLATFIPGLVRFLSAFILLNIMFTLLSGFMHQVE